MRSGCKSQRYNIAQRDHLIQFLESHSMFAAGKFVGKEGKDRLCETWDALANELNSIVGGAHKDSGQWQTVWRDLKHKVSKRVSEIRTEQQRSTGNKERKHPPLAPYELRVAGIIGPEYMQGSSTCPDSIPETEIQLKRLEKGDESVLDDEPQVLVVSFADPKSNEEAEDFNESQYVLDDLVASKDQDDVGEINLYEQENNGVSIEAPANEMFTQASEGFTPRLKKNEQKNQKGKQSADREARMGFQELCVSNNKAMEMLAQASMKQAEAASIQAKAALLHAENEAERVKIFGKLTDVLEKALEKLQ